jgi:hypothetical protein
VGGVPGQWVVVEESKELIKPSKPPGMYKNNAKKNPAGFMHLWILKSPKTPLFTYKYSPETGFSGINEF